ncbi:DUF4328 domain-containing protein [Mycolicibacterium sp.]|uniref:DUF4328 domain-containing protein n=1 Tax=Mycolicibacterium sp. TaxID=2320850 RepID=UPI00355D53DE
MIQVCSSCSTRWNVRDKQRAWCPRCQGRLLPPATTETAAPGAGSGWSRPAQPGGAAPSAGQSAKLPPGLRWIAVRPGAPPPPPARKRPLGLTPRYDFIPRWSLPDPVTFGVEPSAPPPTGPTPTGPTPTQVRRVLTATTAVLAAAALIYLIRYVLLLVNRTVLINSLIAAGATLLGILASVAALAAVITCWVVLTRWLIARRTQLFAHLGRTDRPSRALWAGCMVPLVNLFWAPVFVIETATLEGLYRRLRKPILVWWLLWVLSAVVSVIAFLTLFTFGWISVALNTSGQGVADNTVAMICAYLAALAAVLALDRVYRGFEAKPVERAAHRWVVVGGVPAPAAPGSDFDRPVEPTDREPAA